MLMYEKLPKDISERHIQLLDLVLATGNSANQAIDLLVQKGVPESRIIFLNLIFAPEGIHRVCKRFPFLKIVTSEIDAALNEEFHVIPGEAIFGGKLVIDVAYFGFHIYSETDELCGKTSCPISAGDFLISHSQDLPGFTPPILRSENIEFVVSPCEADAQLAYLSSLEAEKGGIVAVISEDSDLLAYGCPTVVFKMDRYGNGEEIVQNKVFESASRVPSFQSFDKELFTGMCVLAGCDFLPSVPGIGITKAYSLVSKYRNLDRCALFWNNCFEKTWNPDSSVITK